MIRDREHIAWAISPVVLAKKVRDLGRKLWRARVENAILKMALEDIIKRELDGWEEYDTHLCCVEMSCIARNALRITKYKDKNYGE